MQHELVSLERRISSLEDDELEVMGRIEDAQKRPRRARRPDRHGRRAADGARGDARREGRRDRRRARRAGRPARPDRPRDCPRTCSRSTSKSAARRVAWARPSCASDAAPAADQHRRPRDRRDPRQGGGRGRALRGVPADPRAHLRVRAVTDPFRYRRVLIEADGGSRGNPGPRRTAPCSRTPRPVRSSRRTAPTIGVATNNVAEYSGLIAGLKLAAEFAPGADVEVRMDSKLVVEQMSGRWKIKHPDMRPLAAEAARLAPAGTTYTWVPRDRNTHADRLANEALDGMRNGVTAGGGGRRPVADRGDGVARHRRRRSRARPAAGPRRPATATTIDAGAPRRHPGDVGEEALRRARPADNPGLSDEGRARSARSPSWLSPAAARIDAVVSSPVRRTRESADILAELLGRDVEEEPGFAEMEFGVWDGLDLRRGRRARPEGARRRDDSVAGRRARGR